MRKLFLTVLLTYAVVSCTSTKTTLSKTAEIKPSVVATIDLNTIKDDKLKVSLSVSNTTQDIIYFNIPKIVPGTYSTDNFGRFIENLKAYDSKQRPLKVAKIEDNTWQIYDAKKLDKITYWVNDTYDTEIQGGIGGRDVFSPAGTNIDTNCFVINNHGFIGYFSDKKDAKYTLIVKHPENLFGATALQDQDISNTQDVFETARYADLVDNPIMYAKPNYTNFSIEDMDILVSVYSPNDVYKVSQISGGLEKMMRAQKKFLGPINNTKKYAILIYLSDNKKNDAKGFGALEHPTSTTVVMPEIIDEQEMNEQLKDIVSHEFFHIVTPLGIHSKEIQDFDFNNPKMSQHLWMYEGVTEYFSNLFQVQQDLITQDEFYTRMSEKIEQSKTMNDTMPFTQMSQNVLVKPYKDQYLNVYQKGALIGMCLDITLREKSNGKMGVLNLMQQLNQQYGNNKPFNDTELFDIIEKLTYPEVKTFLTTYVSGNTPIPYDLYFKKMGITKSNTKIPGNVFFSGQTPYITINRDTKEIIVLDNLTLPEFYATLDIKPNDIITDINNETYNLDNIYELITKSQSWKQNDPITVKIKRNQKLITLKGKINLPFEDTTTYQFTDNTKKELNEAWLKK